MIGDGLHQAAKQHVQTASQTFFAVAFPSCLKFTRIYVLGVVMQTEC